MKALKTFLLERIFGKLWIWAFVTFFYCTLIGPALVSADSTVGVLAGMASGLALIIWTIYLLVIRPSYKQ